MVAAILCLTAISAALAFRTWWQTPPAPGSVALPIPPPPAAPQRRAAPTRPRVRAGALLGKIEIPRLHIDTPILEGADEPELKRGAGHVPSTALPGLSGNVAIAAHRDKFFRELRFIQPNDEVIVHTEDGDYKYTVQFTEIVQPDDVSVLKQTSGPELTLITCYPFFYAGHAPSRFIVHAEGESVLSASSPP